MAKTTCIALMAGETAAMARGQGGWVLGRPGGLRRQLRAVCHVCRGAGWGDD